ncbi:polysaccharide deacetylase family protein [Halomicronema sp. CCY15110]|uniref:polysaccharide deacetylase family protein n=1 Tax=Halomicronema sp. CCY15110 TaxID=2767773 RepID=UPI001950B84C|nr:polysaccharide deacetylase family protein [Halomicronema sp. CCY15110]
MLTTISVVCFLLGNCVQQLVWTGTTAQLASVPVSAASHQWVNTLQPTFPQVQIRVQPPVTNGTNIDSDLIQQWLGDRSPEVFLTFDDGPSAEATVQILDVLQRHNIKATFFVLGSNVIRLPDVVQRIVAEGHELALHSHTHPNFLTLTREQKEAEIAQSLSLLHWYFPDLRIRWFRPPYGKYDQEVVDIAHDYGMCIAMFNEISTDNTSSAGEIARVVLKSRGKIMVFHDGQWPPLGRLSEPEAQLVAGLNRSVGIAQGQGAKFMTLSDYFGHFCP